MNEHEIASLMDLAKRAKHALTPTGLDDHDKQEKDEALKALVHYVEELERESILQGKVGEPGRQGLLGRIHHESSPESQGKRIERIVRTGDAERERRGGLFEKRLAEEFGGNQKEPGNND